MGVEGAEKAAFDPASAEVVYAMRDAFTKVSKETGKDRALIVSLSSGGGNATQRSVFYGSADQRGADLVLNLRLANALVSGACSGEKSSCVKTAVEDSLRIVGESHQRQYNLERSWANWALSSLRSGRIASQIDDDKFVDAYNL